MLNDENRQRGKYIQVSKFFRVNAVLSSVSDMYHACDLKISQKQ